METKTNGVAKTEARKLPTLPELVGDDQEVFKNDQFNLLLNQDPPANWFLKHPIIKDHHYMTIQRVEVLLTKIFTLWRCEVISYSQLFNSVSCHVRIHYRHPINGEWHYHDGVGACGVQTDKGAAASDLSAIKQDAVMKALPAAKSYAIKDAAEHLGKLFGRDINRKDAVSFTPTYDTKWQKTE